MRKRARILCIMALELVAAARPAVVTAAGERSKVETTAQFSEILSRDIPLSVYLPAKLAANGSRFPVLYLLHGFGDDHSAWLVKGKVAEVLDRMIASGILQPLIVVMPGAGNSWYIDGDKRSHGAIAQAFARDLADGIEARYPAARCRKARAVGGLSMGGYGAIVQGFQHPDRYIAVFSLSGSLFSEHAQDIDNRRPTYERIFGGVFGRPFDPERFLAWNVFTLLARNPREISLPDVWLVAGTDDYPSILAGTKRMHEALVRRGARSDLRILPGGHTWELWHTGIEAALQWLSPMMSANCDGGEAMLR